ncbi:MAG: Gfo/Idh/MocA family oxidoreductase [Pirellulales bacterium]|nr:Gfo/Idh/MocA family oxidoreductase [Pirellulales bacterium]
MSESKIQTDRRKFIRAAGAISALGAIQRVPHVFGAAGVNHTLQIALIGAGGRGTGAVSDALKVSKYPIKLVAVADLFQHRLDESIGAITQQFQSKPGLVDVPTERQFIGFDAYKRAMDALNPGDIAIFATPLAFRWLHFQYAIERGLHVFMEKALIADTPGAHRMFDLAKKADEKNLKVGVGLMIRHCRGRQELHKRIADGEIGELVAMRAYRMHGPVGTCFSKRTPKDRDELLWQIERFHSFLWASGGLFSDFYVHQIDEVCWMKNAWPIKAHGLGGRHFRGDYVDQNFDAYSVEYTFEDGSKFFFNGRTMTGCHNDMASVVHGTKGSAIVSASGHSPGKVRTFKDQKQTRSSQLWAYPQPETSPYHLEWEDLLDAILHDKPYNEVPRGVEACLVANMGRMAAHTGQEVSYEQIFNSKHEMAPGLADFAPGAPAPVTPDKHGKYPVPTPGVNREREYGPEE